MYKKIDYNSKLNTLFTKLKGIDLPIEELDLPVSCYNALKRAGVHKLEQLLMMSGNDIMQIMPNRKDSSCDVIIYKLNALSKEAGIDIGDFIKFSQEDDSNDTIKFLQEDSVDITDILKAD